MTHLDVMKKVCEGLGNSMIHDLQNVKKNCGIDIYKVAIDSTQMENTRYISIVFCPTSTDMKYENDKGMWINTNNNPFDNDSDAGLIQEIDYTLDEGWDDIKLPDFTQSFTKGTPEYEYLVSILHAYSL